MSPARANPRPRTIVYFYTDISTSKIGRASCRERVENSGVDVSSRRRHTRSKRDWSSDVCSSDLGYMDAAVEQLAAWAKAQPVDGMQLEVVRLSGRTPLIFIDVPGTGKSAAKDDCVLLYGHLDKQDRKSVV